MRWGLAGSGARPPTPVRCVTALALLASAGCIPARTPDPQRPALSSPEPIQPAFDAAPGAQAQPPPPPEPMRAASPAVADGPVEVPANAAPPPFKANPVVPRATETRAGSYVVRPGDTLSRIGARTGAGGEAIAARNRLVPPFAIRAGQRLAIPAGRWHRVAAGETGIAIARAYGVEWAGIVAANRLAEPYLLRTGQHLLLPSAAEVATMSVEARAGAFRLDIGDLISGSEPALAARAMPVSPSQPTPGTRQTLPATAAVAAGARFDGRFTWPLTGPILAAFGPFGSGRRNEGIDIAAERGTAVRAAADGVVLYAGTDIAVYGGLVLIRHSDRWTTAYGHAAELLVARGEAVKRGQVIARTGESGSATRPQLHFEIRQGRKPVDPVLHLPRRG